MHVVSFCVICHFGSKAWYMHADCTSAPTYLTIHFPLVVLDLGLELAHVRPVHGFTAGQLDDPLLFAILLPYNL